MSFRTGVASSSRAVTVSSIGSGAGLTRKRVTAAIEALPPSFLLPSQQHLYTTVSAAKSRSKASRSLLRQAHVRPASTSSSTSGSTTSSDLSYPTHLSNPTPYDIFHFPSRTVTSSEVKSRYYDLVRVCHPDRHNPASTSKSKTQVEEEFKAVVQAYNLLKDPRSKQLYDRAGIGWGSSPSSSSSVDWRSAFQDRRYTRRYNPSYAGPGHDRFGWQHQGFYSNQYTSSFAGGGNAGWNGKGHYTSNGVFISTLFVLTWFLAGLQYSRLSLQSQKAVERADKSHMDAARSLNEARELARSEEGRERWRAFRRRVREQRFLEQEVGGHLDGEVRLIEAPSQGENPYGVGHGGPSGKEAAQERFAKAQAQAQAKTAS